MDLQKTQHYTQNDKICGNLIKYIPSDAQLIEPFVGKGNLVYLFPNHNWEMYDLEPYYEGAIIQDTLLIPPNYEGKWVITNPPYLAKNKAKDKTIFNKYKVDDLYKAALMSILNAEGGILIIPANFFTDERTGEVREKFLDVFDILEVNFFSEPVFESTTYSVCSFAFKKKKQITNSQTIRANAMPQGISYDIILEKKFDYRIAGKFYNELKTEKIIFGRLLTAVPDNKYITNIKLFALDGRSEKIRLEYCEEPFYGKSTDRSYATFISDIEIDTIIQKKIINRFNTELNKFREEFGNLSLTNYRDYNRKRIGFTMAYQLASKVYREIIEEDD